MPHRRNFLKSALLAAAPGMLRAQAAPPSANGKLGIPGPFPGRVVETHHPGCIVNGAYQQAPVSEMMHRGIMELTGAHTWQDAWKTFFQPGDVVGIKVSPVGGAKLCSDATVMHEILAGLAAAGVPAKDVVVFSRYRKEISDAGIDKWVPSEVHITAPSHDYSEVQLDMDGYDPNVYIEMALKIPQGENSDDPKYRRSHVAKVVTQQVNKIINLPVLKHHQSAGVTIALKNMSHGCVNNVNRSHLTSTLNACGEFIPTVVNLPVFRQKVVLHICDAVKSQYHGGPGYREQFVWEPKMMYFATDPVALDKTGLKALDAKRAQVGMESIALSKPDKYSHFLNCQVEHIEIAGSLGLGEFDDRKIDVRRIALT